MFSLKSRARMALAVVVVPCLTAAPVLADSVLLSTLLQGGTIQQGDKLFSNFTYGPTGDMPAASAINVTGIGTGVGTDYYGIRFQGGFTDNVGGGGSDALITYRVTVLDPNYVITDAHLDSNLVVHGDPGDPTHVPHGTIDETFTAVVPPTPVLAGVFNTNFNFDNDPNHTQLHDDYTWGLPGYTVIDVQKDIFLDATNFGTGDVGLSFVDQRFSQNLVPVPAAFWGGLALFGVVLSPKIRRRPAE